MKEYTNKIIEGDCLEVMKELPDNSVDAIITDPPYELNFMNKKWDGSGVAYKVELWQECLRVLKPGGHLLSFGGSRTYHRMACAIEDAGFEIRDQIQWLYGSGFPKSQNIGKAIDKAAGRSRQDEIEFAQHIKEIRVKHKKTVKEWNQEFGYVAGCLWWETERENGYRPPNQNDYEILKTKYGASEKYQKIVDRWHPVGEKIGNNVRGNAGFSKEQVPRPWKEKIGEEYDITAPATSEAKQWEGWGSALKPAHEPIVLARKPLSEKTIAANVLKWGTGGINIDGCRVEGEKGVPASLSNEGQHGWNTGGDMERKSIQNGRFPANLILSYPEDEYMLREDVKPEQLIELGEWLNENA